MYDSRNKFYLLIPTRDGMTMGITMAMMFDVALKMRRQLKLFIDASPNLAFSRTNLVKLAYDDWHRSGGTGYCFGFFLDNDIGVESSIDEIISGIRYAEEHEASVFGNYKRGDGTNLTYKEMKPPFEQYTTAELAKLDNYALVGGCAIGFSYIRLPEGYEWHHDSTSEDIWYCKEIKEPMHLCKDWRLAHQKNVWLK